jgi:hypothetical protein
MFKLAVNLFRYLNCGSNLPEPQKASDAAKRERVVHTTRIKPTLGSGKGSPQFYRDSSLINDHPLL